MRRWRKRLLLLLVQCFRLSSGLDKARRHSRWMRLKSASPARELPETVSEAGLHGSGDFPSGGVATEVRRERLAGGQQSADGGFDGGGSGVLAEVLHHHRGCKDCAERVGLSLPRDVGRGAVDWLEERGVATGGVQVGARGEPDAARDDGAQVAQDVSEEVGSDDDIERGGAADEVHRRGVNQQRVGGDVGILSGDGTEDAVPQNHGVGLRVGLGDRGDAALPVAAAGQFEGVANDTLATEAGKD